MHGSGRVAVIDSLSDSLVACVTTNTGAFGIAAHPASNSIFVGNRDGLDLWRINGATNTATPVKDWSNGKGGGSPFYVGVNPATNLLFAMVGLPSSDIPNKLYVYSIDGAGNLSNERVAAIGNTDDGGFVVQSQCSGNIFIAETADNQVRILTSNLSSYGVVTEASGLVGHGPFGLLENPTLKRVYVSNKPANTLSVLNECPGPLAPAAMQAMTPVASATLPPASKTPTMQAPLTKTPAPTLTSTKTLMPKPAPTITPTPTNAPASTLTPTRTATPTVRATNTITATSPITKTK
jgi:DNA-binding beta-propeller fold protein YncE